MNEGVKNWFRHFGWALWGGGYLSTGFMLVYQYLGMAFGDNWPGIFFSKDVRPDGWWLSVDYTSPFLWSFFAAVIVAAALFATWKRTDFGSYRDSEVESQAGF